MRIYNEDDDKTISEVTVFLTLQQAKQLNAYLSDLIENPKLNHFHIDNGDYTKEITVSIYDPNDNELEDFHERSKKIIKEDK